MSVGTIGWYVHCRLVVLGEYVRRETLRGTDQVHEEEMFDEVTS